MKILLNNNDLNEALSGISNLGFIPTMGSLHQGHISLIKKSLKKCKKTIVSIFVNPTQFNDKKDFLKYPRNNKKDLFILKRLKVNFVYLPSVRQIYNSKKDYKVKLNKKEKVLCAKYRKNHFEGVINVMHRLTRLIKPQKIFMGEKDFQQVILVKKYIQKKYNCKIISCKTFRGKNKIALSSRNNLLNKKSLFKAGKVAQDLISFKKKLIKSRNLKISFLDKWKELEKRYKIKIEYFELRNIYNLKMSNKVKKSKIFIAYYINRLRLIDNF